MTLPITNIQPGIPNTQTANSSVNNVPAENKDNLAAASINTPAQTQSVISAQPAAASMTAPLELGVINPPVNNGYSFSNEMNTKLQEKKDIFQSTPLSASSLGYETQKPKGILGKLVLLGGITAGGIMILKNLKKGKNISDIAASTKKTIFGNKKTGIANKEDLSKYLNNLVEAAKKSKIHPSDLKASTIRVIDESADSVKDILNSTRKIAKEARNIEGKTPKIVIKLKEGAQDASKAIKEAVSKNTVDTLGEDILKNIEYINLEYVTSDKKATNIILETLTSKIQDGSPSQAASKFESFIKAFFSE